MVRCIFCGREATDKHHIIKKSQGGTDAEINLALLCRACHFAVHNSKDKEYMNLIKEKCYKQIRGRLDECWSGKIKPKIVRILENKDVD
jgi:5-methylcytosine-specific restriction endonuclease McrA